MIGSMIGFLIFNLRFVGKKRAVFLGDHGSNMIGFWVAWAAIFSSQSSIYQIMPITTVWFVAIPLLDCIGLIVSRKARGISWSTPGRDHIHHKLMNKYSPDGALGAIIVACVFSWCCCCYCRKAMGCSYFICIICFVCFCILFLCVLL